jgi:hypothetical protein
MWIDVLNFDLGHNIQNSCNENFTFTEIRSLNLIVKLNNYKLIVLFHVFNSPQIQCILVVQDAQDARWLKMWAAQGIQCMVLVGAFSFSKAQLQQENKVVGWGCF